LVAPENFDLKPYARFNGGFWVCNSCKDKGDRFFMLYHLRRDHQVNDVSELCDIQQIRKTFTECKSKASVETPLPHDSWQIRRDQYYHLKENAEPIPSGPYNIPDFPPINDGKHFIDTNYYPYFVCKDCLHFVCFFDIVDREPVTYGTAVSKAKLLKFQEDNK
jgi:hypothetical protein